MPEHRAETGKDLLSNLGYESRDIVMSTMVKWIIALVVLIAFGITVPAVLFFVFRGYAPTGEVPYAINRSTNLPPEPRIQSRPRMDLREFHDREQERLDTYGRDPRTGAIHVPIQQAIGVLAARGLPVRTTGATPPDASPPAGAAAATESAPGPGDHEGIGPLGEASPRTQGGR